MRYLFILISLLFISCQLDAQLGPAQSALFYGTQGSDKPPLVFEASTTVYSTTQVQAQSGGNSLMSPRLLWENGRTHYVFQDVSASTGGRHFILTYDERYGLGRPVGHGVTQIETHHRPAFIKYNDKFYITAERNHNSVPLTVWDSRADDDAMIFNQTTDVIGTIPTYPNIYNKNGVFTILNQSNDINAKYTKNSSGNFLGTWTAEEQITSRQADEDEHYVAAPNNGDFLPNEIVFLVGGRNDDTSPATWFNKYIIRATVTASDITYRNWTNTYSTTSQIGGTQMITYFKYFGTASDVTQAYAPVTAIDKQGNFYDVTGNGVDTYKFVYMIAGQSSPTEKSISLPSSPTIMDGADVGLDGQNGGCPFLLAVNPHEVYAFFRISVGGEGRIYMYKTVDLGDNWTFEQDIFGDQSEHIYGFTMAYNALGIPNNRNFICIGTGVGAPLSNMYIKRCAWGSIQHNETQSIFDNYTAYSASEYDALMIRSYYIETGKVTNTGTTLNTVIDQSPSAQDATTTGSPVLDNGTTPTKVAIDGTNDALIVPTTGLTALTEGTIFVVVDPNATGTALNFLTFSRSGVASPFQAYGKSTTDLTRVQDSGDLDVRGSTSITDAYHILAYTMQNGQCAVLQWLDGEMQFRTETTPSNGEGRFTSGLSPTIDRISIGRLVRNTTSFSAFDFKHCAFSSTPLTTEQTYRALKYLANKYSISLTDHYLSN